MSSFREDVLDLANDIRENVPRDLDLRQLNVVEIVRRDWVGMPGGDGGYKETVTELVERYKVSQVTTDQVASSGGVYEIGDIRVGPITPYVYTIAQLDPSLSTGRQRNRTEIEYRLSGPHSGLYRLRSLETVSDTSWFLVLRRTERQPTAGQK